MRRTVLLLPLILAALGGPLLAQEEPPLFENPPPATQAAPTPTPPCPPSVATLGLKSPKADVTLWQAMIPRERESYVEVGVAIMGALAEGLRDQATTARSMPREDLSALIRFANLYAPRRAPAMYLKEMERIYKTDEGQKLLMSECFYKAFERVNVPAALTMPSPAAKKPEDKPADQ
jgi:hypothetical protein